MKFKKYYRLTIISLVFFVKYDLAQDSLQNFLASLNNNDAKSYLALVAPKKFYDSASGRIYAHTIERRLKSIDIDKVQKTFPKYLMVKNLVRLLGDPERDWYADLLLYNLTRIESLNIVGCDTRNDWLTIKRGTNITYKQLDEEMWMKYLSDLSPSSEY